MASLVGHAERTRSIGGGALEDARDDEAPQQALARLLLGALDVVAEQRRVHLQALVDEEQRRRQEEQRRRQQEQQRRAEEARKRLVTTQRCTWCKQPMPADYSGIRGERSSR